MIAILIASAPVSAAEVALRPIADGTIIDGGVFGSHDGTPDAADWFFNESSYEGAISLAHSPLPGFEHRVVFEFRLTTITLELPVAATLRFELRGVARFPADPAVVNVYAYQADLGESLTDFDQGPAELITAHEIAPFQTETQFIIDVSSPVNDALATGWDGVGFRFQIDPHTPNDASQAFMNIVESDPDTKPLLTVTDQLPGDIDGDRDIDENDYTLFPACFGGPDPPVAASCRVYDFDADRDVDLFDFARFTRLQAIYGK